MTVEQKEQMVVDNIPLIYSIVNDHFSSFSDREDLVQEGAKEMWKVIDNYDDSMGAKFTTFAYSHIYWAIRKYIRENKGIKVSRNLTKINLMIEKATILLAQQLMREPSMKEISDYLELPEYMIAEAIGSTYSIQSINEPITNDGKELTIEDITGEDGTDRLDNVIMLSEAIDELDPIERELILNRYMSDKTQQETADILDMSQVQVYRKEQKVLTKLKTKIAA